MLKRREALNLLEKEKITGKTLRHSKKVNQIANYLVKELSNKGIKIDSDIVDIASLLHDIGRYRSDTTKVSHEIESYNILKEINEEHLAEIVRKHALPQINNLNSWEEKIVYYSDKRGEEDSVTDIEERFKRLIKRHPEAKELIKKIRKDVLNLEKEIFDKIGWEYEPLNELKTESTTTPNQQEKLNEQREKN